MNRTVRIIAVILALGCIVAAPLLASGKGETSTATGAVSSAGGPLTKYAPGITLTLAGAELDPNEKFPAGMDPEHNPWRDAYANEMGITFTYKWVVPGSHFTEKLNTQIAAGDVPDILNGLGAGQYKQLRKIGLAVAQDDLIAKYATDLTKKILNSDGGYSLTISRGEDGKLYALPHVYGYTDNVTMMWLRTDWLKKLGLQAPKTTDELYTVLKAFVQNDPDGNGKADTVGLTSTSALWEVNSIFNAFGAQPFWSWYKDDSGTLRYCTVYRVEAMKAALAFMNRLYKEGLMHQEFGTANYDKFLELQVSGKSGIAFTAQWYPAASLQSCIDNNPNADWDAYAIPTGLANGAPAKPFAYYGPACYNVISTRCAYPEIGVKILNLYTEKVFGPNASATAEKYIMRPEYNMRFFSIIASEDASSLSLYDNVAAALKSKDPSKLLVEERLHYDAAAAYLAGDTSKWAEWKTYGPDNAVSRVVKYYQTKAVPLFNNFYGPQTEAVAQYQGTLDAKWNTVCVEIIMGQKPVSAYDDFVKDWYALGGDKMEKEVNAWAKAHPESVK
jgi:putative aldouronate transport system substrate-binding protein